MLPQPSILSILSISDLIDALVPLTEYHGRSVTWSTYQKKAYALLTEHQLPFVPMGIGNRKTASIGLYRPVGDGPDGSCPPSCPHSARHDGSCYALMDKVGMVQKRASNSAIAYTNSLAVAVVGSRCSTEETSRYRTHVSGDWGQTWDEARITMRLAKRVLAVARDKGIPRPKGWGYSHLPTPIPPDCAQLIADLAALGCHILISDVAALTLSYIPSETPKQKKQRARALHPKAFVCPATLSKHTTCATCQACFNGTASADRPVVFPAHGANKNKASSSVIGGSHV